MNEENNFNTVGETNSIETPVTPIEEPVNNVSSIETPVTPIEEPVVNNTSSTNIGKKKGNKGLIGIVIILAVAILGLGGYYAYSKGWIGGKEEPKKTDKKEETKEEKTDVDAVLEQLHGQWGNKNYGIKINKEEKTYLEGQYASDGFIGGVIKNIKKLSKNTYELEVYSEGCKGSDCMVESDPATNFVVIEIDEEKKIIKNNNNDFELVTKDLTDQKTIEEYFYKYINQGESTPVTKAQIYTVGNNKYIDDAEHTVGNITINGFEHSVSYQQRKCTSDDGNCGFVTKVKFSHNGSKEAEVEIVGGGIDELAVLDDKYVFIKEARDIKDAEGVTFYLLGSMFKVEENISGVTEYVGIENGQTIAGTEETRTLGYIDINHFKVGVCTSKAEDENQTYKEYTYTVKDGKVTKVETYSKSNIFCSAQKQ